MYPLNKRGHGQALHPIESRIEDVETIITKIESNPIVGYAYHVCEGLFYCPFCGGVRRGSIQWDPIEYYQNGDMVPLEGECLQCKHHVYFLLYKKKGEWDLIYAYDTDSGISTPNTPHNVKYYLDQAFRCKCAGAMSASMAMYRAALDSILFNAGYTKGMLGDRIKELENDTSSGKAPEGLNMDTEFMRVLKDLGNSAVHTNDGDISRQEVFDKELLMEVDVVMVEILESVYEAPAKRKARLDSLKNAKQQVNK